jgi:hypothetical protein
LDISKKFTFPILDHLCAHNSFTNNLFFIIGLCFVQPGSVYYIFNIGANTKSLMKIRTPTKAVSLRKTSERAHAYANIYQIAACIVAKPLQHGTANHSLFGPVRARRRSHSLSHPVLRPDMEHTSPAAVQIIIQNLLYRRRRHRRRCCAAGSDYCAVLL